MKKKLIVAIISIPVLILLFAFLVPYAYIRSSRSVFRGFAPDYESSYRGLYCAKYEVSAEERDDISSRIPARYSSYTGSEAYSRCWMIGMVLRSDYETQNIDLGYISITTGFLPSPFATYYEMIVRVPTDTGYSVYCLFDIKNNRTK